MRSYSSSTRRSTLRFLIRRCRSCLSDKAVVSRLNVLVGTDGQASVGLCIVLIYTADIDGLGGNVDGPSGDNSTGGLVEVYGSAVVGGLDGRIKAAERIVCCSG